MIRLSLIFCTIAAPCLAQDIVPVRAIRAGTTIAPNDLRRVETSTIGAVDKSDMVIGKEAARTLYPNQPIFASDLVVPALVERNQPVFLMFKTPVISIIAEGRALGRGRSGQMIKAMNLASKTVVFGHIQSDGTVLVQN